MAKRQKKIQNYFENFVLLRKEKYIMKVFLTLMIGLAMTACSSGNSGEIPMDNSEEIPMDNSEEIPMDNSGGAGIFPFICPNGIPLAAKIDTENITSCTSCMEDFDLIASECRPKPTFPFVCPNGTATDGMTTTRNTQSCSACTTTGYRLFGTECFTYRGNFTRVGMVNQFGLDVGSASGLTTFENTLYMVGRVIFSVSGMARSPFYRINLGGSATLLAVGIGEFGIARTSASGLASHDSKFYMIDDTNDTLNTLDITSGAATRVGSANNFGSANVTGPAGLASHQGSLYMVGQSGTNPRGALYILNTTSGEATQVESTTVNFGTAGNFRGEGAEVAPSGLASHQGSLYMVGNTNDILYRLDITNGVATRVGSAVNFGVGESAPSGLASIGNTLYLVGGNNILYSSEVY